MSYRVQDKTDVDNDVIVPFHLWKTTIKFTLIIEDLPYNHIFKIGNPTYPDFSRGIHGF